MDALGMGVRHCGTPAPRIGEAAELLGTADDSCPLCSRASTSPTRPPPRRVGVLSRLSHALTGLQQHSVDPWLPRPGDRSFPGVSGCRRRP